MVELSIENWAEASAYEVYLNNVNSKCRKVETRIGAASKQIKTMRSTGEQRMQVKPLEVRAGEMLSTIFAGFMACFRINKPSTAMCKHYGHRIDKTWKGLFPRCLDCDCVVRDPKSLRRSSTY
ncbi:MAG: hypothetical protein K2X77_08295 [Candidatus Obscuribacterales bacterium]|jgi:hypothetical protein|nr:hypothetical protein [Candidatus Obscuribacterales bacterium]